MKKKIVHQASTLALRAAICVIGGIVLLLCIFALPAMWAGVAAEFPTITYVFYGILSALYIAAIPFFYALYQALKLLSYIDKNKAFSKRSVQALRIISYCGVFISIVFIAILPLLFEWAQYEDAPGLIVIGMLMAGASLTVAIFAGLVQRLLHQVISIKSENDLTV